MQPCLDKIYSNRIEKEHISLERCLFKKRTNISLWKNLSFHLHSLDVTNSMKTDAQLMLRLTLFYSQLRCFNDRRTSIFTHCKCMFKADFMKDYQFCPETVILCVIKRQRIHICNTIDKSHSTTTIILQLIYKQSFIVYSIEAELHYKALLHHFVLFISSSIV